MNYSLYELWSFFAIFCCWSRSAKSQTVQIITQLLERFKGVKTKKNKINKIELKAELYSIKQLEIGVLSESISWQPTTLPITLEFNWVINISILRLK